MRETGLTGEGSRDADEEVHGLRSPKVVRHVIRLQMEADEVRARGSVRAPAVKTNLRRNNRWVSGLPN